MRKHAFLYAVATAFCALAGFLVRNLELNTLLDRETMLMDFGAWSVILLLLILGVLAAYVVIGRKLKKPVEPLGYAAVFRGKPMLWSSIVSLLVSAVVALLCFRRWQRGESGMLLVLALMILLSGFGWLMLALSAQRNRRSCFLWAAALPELAACLFLILFYKTYAPQPSLLYTVYPFLGLCAALGATHLISGYTVKINRPGLALFCCGAAAVVCITAIPGVHELEYRLYMLTLSLECFFHGLYLLVEPETLEDVDLLAVELTPSVPPASADASPNTDADAVPNPDATPTAEATPNPDATPNTDAVPEPNPDDTPDVPDEPAPTESPAAEAEE